MRLSTAIKRAKKILNQRKQKGKLPVLQILYADSPPPLPVDDGVPLLRIRLSCKKPAPE